MDAITAVRDEKVRYSAIFMDHMMPGMDGMETTRVIREELGTAYARNIPIIALTANAIAGNEDIFLSKGFQAFISKPIDIVKLDSVINRWVRDKSQEKESFTAPDAEILIVDDNEVNIKVALGLLRPLQLRIDTAANGQEALRMIRNKRYHLIFMDHMMPVMDGIETTVRLRGMEGEYYKTVPVIALTANDESDAREVFLQAGMNDFVTKPILVKEISEKIKRWLPDGLVRDGNELSTAKPAQEPRAIPGIDAREGIRNSGSEKLWLNSLGNFYKLIDLKSGRIDSCLAQNLVKDLTIEVHTLKSTARLIGANELSEAFARLERYGNQEDLSALAREVPEVLAQYRSFKPVLAVYGEAVKDARPARAGEPEHPAALLRKLVTALDSFDLDGADEAMSRLDALRLPDEYRPQMELLRAYVADVAAEEAVAAANALIERVEQING
jgi:CheY-like chemotaxis protein